jgi:hypothetical protein
LKSAEISIAAHGEMFADVLGGGAMESTDLQRVADSILREYGVPLRVSQISAVDAGWTIAFDAARPGAAPRQVSLRCCERSSIHHIRELLKRGLDVSD